MEPETLRERIDGLVDLAMHVYSFLETYERNLIRDCRQDIEGEEEVTSKIQIRKRFLGYLIKDKQQFVFQTLWDDYQTLFRSLYREFHIRSASPFQDDLFASREIIEDAMIEARDGITFKHVFFQKAYQCFGVDFEPVRENCLFVREEDKDNFSDEEFHKDFEEEQSQVCRMM